MAPIYDTDLEKERWIKAQWENYELWEQIEAKLRRRKRIWIATTVFIALLIFSIPVVIERKAKWLGQVTLRDLAREINSIKVAASLEHSAFRISFDESGQLNYQLSYRIDRMKSCGEPGASGEFVRSGSLDGGTGAERLVFLDMKRAEEMNLPGILNEFCYDPTLGSESALKGNELAAFAFIPANDLTGRRSDRVSLLFLNGESAEISVH
ncbi:MAG: hypothetical protein AABZ06_09925 [Bdellovibrionota bacterium]